MTESILSVVGFAYGSKNRPFRTTFRYRPLDPYAIHMDVFGKTVATWSFDRELLNTGTIEPIGTGDVHVYPVVDKGDGAMVAISLTSPTGHIEIQYSMDRIADWLCEVYTLVPEDTESSFVDWDAEFAYLTNQSFGD